MSELTYVEVHWQTTTTVRPIPSCRKLGCPT